MRCAIKSVVWNERLTSILYVNYEWNCQNGCRLVHNVLRIMKSAHGMGNVYYKTAHTGKPKEIGVFNIILLIVKINNCTHSNTWMLKSFKFQSFKWGSFRITTPAHFLSFILPMPSLENSTLFRLCLRFNKQYFVFVDQDNEDKQRTCTRQANKSKDTPISKSTQ